VTVKIAPTADFIKALSKLPPDRQEKARKSLVLFQQEQKLARFDFRSLSGRSGYFIINSARGDRIILRRVGPDAYEAVDVGAHDLYRRWNR
jgi:hypothetical protein